MPTNERVPDAYVLHFWRTLKTPKGEHDLSWWKEEERHSQNVPSQRSRRRHPSLDLTPLSRFKPRGFEISGPKTADQTRIDPTLARVPSMPNSNLHFDRLATLYEVSGPLESDSTARLPSIKSCRDDLIYSCWLPMSLATTPRPCSLISAWWSSRQTLHSLHPCAATLILNNS